MNFQSLSSELREAIARVTAANTKAASPSMPFHYTPSSDDEDTDEEEEEEENRSSNNAGQQTPPPNDSRRGRAVPAAAAAAPLTPEEELLQLLPSRSLWGQLLPLYLLQGLHCDVVDTAVTPSPAGSVRDRPLSLFDGTIGAMDLTSTTALSGALTFSWTITVGSSHASPLVGGGGGGLLHATVVEAGTAGQSSPWLALSRTISFFIAEIATFCKGSTARQMALLRLLDQLTDDHPPSSPRTSDNGTSSMWLWDLCASLSEHDYTTASHTTTVHTDVLSPLSPGSSSSSSSILHSPAPHQGSAAASRTRPSASCVGSVLRSLLELPVLAERIVKPYRVGVLLQEVYVFDVLFPSVLQPHSPLLSTRGTIAAEGWSIVDTLLRTHKELMGHLVSSSSSLFCSLVSGIAACSLPTSHYVAQREALRMASLLLGDPSYGRLRLQCAESPLLLSACLRATSSCYDGVLFEVYHCLKVFLSKVQKPSPIRYLLWLNKDELRRLFHNGNNNNNSSGMTASSGGSPGGPFAGFAGSGGGGSGAVALFGRVSGIDEGELALLLQRLTQMEALSREELVVLGVDPNGLS